MSAFPSRAISVVPIDATFAPCMPATSAVTAPSGGQTLKSLRWPLAVELRTRVRLHPCHSALEFESRLLRGVLPKINPFNLTEGQEPAIATASTPFSHPCAHFLGDCVEIQRI